MPKLTQYTSQSLPTGQFQTRQASSEDLGGDLGLTRLGSAAQQVAEVVQARREREEVLKADQKLAHDRIAISERMLALQKELPHGGVGIDEAMTDELESFGDTGDFETRAASQHYLASLEKLKTQAILTSQNTNAVASAAQEKFITGEALETLTNAVRADPTQAPSVIEQKMGMIDRMNVGEDVKAVMREQQTEATWSAVVDTTLSRVKTVEQAEAMEESLLSETWQRRLTPEKYAQALTKIDKTIETLGAQREAALVSDMNERFREVSNGVGLDRVAEDKATINSTISDPKLREKLLKGLDDSARVGEVYAEVVLASHTELVSMGEELMAALQEPGNFDLDTGRLKAFSVATEKRFKAEVAQLGDISETVKGITNGVGVGRAEGLRTKINDIISDPTTREKLIKAVDDAEAIGSVPGQVEGASAVQVNQIGQQLNDALKDPGGFELDVDKLKAYGHALERRAKEIENDAVAYTAKVNPDVATKYQEWKTSPSPDTLEAFVNATTTEQMNQGIDPRDVVLLGRSDVEGMRSMLRDIDDNKRPQELMGHLSQMQSDYGEHWPTVYKQLQQEKVFAGTEALAGNMMNRNPAAATDLIVANGYTDDTFKKLFGPKYETVKKDVGTAVVTAMAGFYGTAFNQPGGDSIIKDHSEAVTRLAMYYHSRYSMAINKAAQTAANHVVLDNYDIVGTYRVPKSVNAPVQTIEAGAKSLLQTFDMDNVVPFLSSTPGLPDSTIKEMTIDSIRSNGGWLTNGDETGLIMMKPNGMGAVEVIEDGVRKPLEFTWDEIVNSGYFEQQQQQSEAVSP